MLKVNEHGSAASFRPTGRYRLQIPQHCVVEDWHLPRNVNVVDIRSSCRVVYGGMILGRTRSILGEIELDVQEVHSADLDTLMWMGRHGPKDTNPGTGS